MAKYVRGLDVARYEPVIDWAKLRAQEIRFVFIKATQRSDYVDPKFLTHWTNAKQAGILRGAYHFLDPDVDATAQARHFLDTVKLEPGDLPPVLDLEDVPDFSNVTPAPQKGKGAKTVQQGLKMKIFTNTQIINSAATWLAYVEQATGRRPILYSSPAFLGSRMVGPKGLPSWANQYVLWIANYLNHPVTEADLPLQPHGWSNWSFWQYSDHEMLDGIYNDDGRTQTAVDKNFFRGSLEDLYALAGAAMPADGVGEPPQSGEPEDVKDDKVVIPTSAPSTVPVTPAPVIPTSVPVTEPATYCIEPGDTLFALAMKFNTTVQDILAANPQITNPDLIFAGEILNIPQT
jgi:GH25 family lysozyme M1 (1,4-beta-N-acetylmuramidase)